LKLVLLLAILLAGSATPALAGWRGAEWGMTAEAVTAAQPEVRPVRNGDRVGDKRKLSAGRSEVAGITVDTHYYYDAKGLAMVVLRVPTRQCQAVANHLQQTLGAPKRISDQVILRLFIWHNEPAQNRLRLLVSASFCDLHVERLSEYREFDLAPPKP